MRNARHVASNPFARVLYAYMTTPTHRDGRMSKRGVARSLSRDNPDKWQRNFDNWISGGIPRRPSDVFNLGEHLHGLKARGIFGVSLVWTLWPGEAAGIVATYVLQNERQIVSNDYNELWAMLAVINDLWIVSQRVVYEPRLGEVGGQPVITAESLAV